jgi:hypothetical protein
MAWLPGNGMVRAAAFSVGGTERGGVTFTVQVPDGFHAPADGGGATATLLITSNEARGFASRRERAAGAADVVGPPLYE